MFRRLQPEAAVIPVISTGGATLDVGAQVESLAPDLTEDRDYVALFHRHLDVSVREERFESPALQPAVVEERFWQPPATRSEERRVGKECVSTCRSRRSP